MDQKIDNRLKGCNVEGDYVGGNQTKNYYISMFQDNEREFVVTHNANIKPVSYFTGREIELQELRQRIEDGRKSVLVSGMGGIGKTHICRKLFEEYLNKHAEGKNETFKHIGYIEYNGDMGSSLQNGLKFKQQDSPEHNLVAAWRELEYLASDGKLLLFVDNVNASIASDTSLERLKHIPGAIILTSRRTSFSREFEPYRIGFLSTEQCRKIYERIRFEDSGKRINEEEVSDLDYIIDNLAARHTITVEFLAHLAQTKRWTVKRLRDELEKNGFRLEYTDEEDELVNIQKSYEFLYDLSALTEAEQDILEAFSLFPYIPLSAEVCNQWLQRDAGVSEVDDILTGLYRKGWLQFDIEQESYTLHPVFAQFIYEKCRPGVEMHYGLIKACQECLKIPESGSVLECQKYIPFAENIIEKIVIKDKLKQTGLMTQLAYFLQYIAEYEKAMSLYEKVLDIYMNELEVNYLYVASIYNNLAVIYMEQGKYKSAEEFFEKSLQINKSILGENHEDVAIGYNSLAGVYKDLGKYEKAEELLKKGISICENILDESHPILVTAYNILSQVYMEMEEYRKAEKLCKRCLRIRENISGYSSLDIAISYNNLAGIYYRQGELKKAEKIYKKSLQIRESVFGEKHIKTAIVYHNLAGIYMDLDEYDKAKKMLYKSLRIWKRTFGEKHPNIANSYYCLAKGYEKEKEDIMALNYYFKAYRICVLLLGVNHFHTQDVYASMQLLWYKSMIRGSFNAWLEKKMKE